MEQWTSRLAELMADWRYFVEKNGWRAALPIIMAEIARLPYRRMKFCVVACSVSEPLPKPQPKVPLEIHRFEKAHLEMVRQIDRPSEVLLCTRRLAHNHIGFIAFYKGKPAGFAWASNEADSSLERVHVRLDNGDMTCVDAYTAPECRRLGVQTALVSARLQLMHNLGYRRAVCYIEEKNNPSLSVWRKFGSQVIGHVDFIRIGPWRWQRHVRFNNVNSE